jgi:trans-aconitate 2-methyltransferase
VTWNPEQYLKFAQPRLRPALDLLGRIPLEAPRAVVDLGCGTGNVTRLLAERWPEATVTGVDDSAEMLASATKNVPGVTWLQASLAAWRPETPVDVLFTNATLHWLPDHQRLLPAFADLVAPGGVLAIQMPRNFSAPSHTAILDTIRAGSWRGELEPLWRPAPVQAPAFYHEILVTRGRALDIWETEYLHVLHGTDPVKEWTKGTWLKPFLDRLNGEDRDAFEREYAARLSIAYPPRPDGTTLFPFRRLFIVLEK